MRIVIDTNVLIGALANPSGNGAQVVNAWLEGRLDVVSSQATLREAETTIEELYRWEFDGPFLKDFCGRRPAGQARDAGAVEYRGLEQASAEYSGR